jgi:hypothetical protein
MRPSSETGVIALLDTLFECKVVLDALNDSGFPQTPMGPEFEDFANSLGVRFRRQTMYEPRPPAADAYVEPVFNSIPEFRVKPEDVDFIKSAALRVLDEKDLKRKLYYDMTRRTAAAQTMIRFFER